jgi:hypothetical protein
VNAAADAATRQANAICTGTVADVEKTATICFGGASPYACTVFVKAACQVQGH